MPIYFKINQSLADEPGGLIVESKRDTLEAVNNWLEQVEHLPVRARKAEIQAVEMTEEEFEALLEL